MYIPACDCCRAVNWSILEYGDVDSPPLMIILVSDCPEGTSTLSCSHINVGVALDPSTVAVHDRLYVSPAVLVPEGERGLTITVGGGGVVTPGLAWKQCNVMAIVSTDHCMQIV